MDTAYFMEGDILQLDGPAWGSDRAGTLVRCLPGDVEGGRPVETLYRNIPDIRYVNSKGYSARLVERNGKKVVAVMQHRRKAPGKDYGVFYEDGTHDHVGCTFRRGGCTRPFSVLAWLSDGYDMVLQVEETLAERTPAERIDSLEPNDLERLLREVKNHYGLCPEFDRRVEEAKVADTVGKRLILVAEAAGQPELVDTLLSFILAESAKFEVGEKVQAGAEAPFDVLCERNNGSRYLLTRGNRAHETMTILWVDPEGEAGGIQ